ncbi:unnamed protein product [Gongylonema pulchrum]|uniref:VWFA domain-containing protein n=1 Tax=Gongylonema pulchrum TaxID=637853 RepID=A0A183EUV1_9BILA|nr:unnamed protein product [Gongylonema pulchrum]
MGACHVFILVSDGYGQEYWHVVQSTGKKLQSAAAEVYAVSTSRDYSLAELTLYTGDEKRVYVGPQHQQ